MKFQPPKGTRDFYPQDMAWRQLLFDTWRRVSIRHGFEEVDGPIFELLDLYKVKSGQGIVNELFHFEDRGERELAIRPEFTPTLARMVAAKAASLPKPAKWFCIPTLCRAERPQRGRLRQFDQWNCDVIGSNSPLADAETIFVAIDALHELGLSPNDVQVKISHRQAVQHILHTLGVPTAQTPAALELLDKREKIDPAAFEQQTAGLGLHTAQLQKLDQLCNAHWPMTATRDLGAQAGLEPAQLADLEALAVKLTAFGIDPWCQIDLGIVRGLAYYTGTVFEIHEASGNERALAGGGRYDQLIELFDGPPTPAVGFGMGDVVLTNVLIDKRLIPHDLAARPDIFVVPAQSTTADPLLSVVAQLRQRSLHTRLSYKTTTNLGKLLKEADASGARYALILDDPAMTVATLKDLATGNQAKVSLDDIQRIIDAVAMPYNPSGGLPGGFRGREKMSENDRK